MKKKSIRQMLAGVMAVVLIVGNLSISAGAASTDPAPSLTEPKIEIQGNVVCDQFGKLTGFFELGIFMQTMPGQSVQSVMMALEYNPDVLAPVTWDAVADGTTGEVTTIPLAGADDYMVQLPGKKTDGITAAVALTGDKQGAGEVGTEGKSLLYFRAESQKSIVLPELTQLAVIRFHVAGATMEKFKLSDDGELTYDGGVGNLETFVDFTTEAAAAQSPALRTLHCVCDDFEYVKTAAAGYKPLDPASIALTLVSNESFSKTGIDIDKLCVITYTDWDGSTLGTQVVPQNADVRKMVNDYVKTNFFHPELQSNENYDSLAREDSYRGKYPHVGPGNGNEFPDLLPDGTANPNAGGKFQLSNKLDYVFLKRVLELDTTDPSNPIWKQSNDKPYDTAYPYIHGWALVASSEGDTWTTLGVGELENYNATNGELPVTDENEYFKLAGFSDIEVSEMTVKAIYEPGTELVQAGAYTPQGEETYIRYGEISSEKGSTYAIGFKYERIDGTGHGVGRMRDPALRLEYTPDDAGEGGTPYYLRGDVENKDIITTEITPPSTIRSVDYVFVDKYQVNFIVGTPRTSRGNILAVPTNFDYANFSPKSREGTSGFVYIATLNGVLDIASKVVIAEKTGNAQAIASATGSFNSFVTLGTLKDLNLKYDGSGAVINNDNFENAKILLLDAIRKAFAAGAVENGIAKLNWHQLQYHFANIDISAYPIIKGGVFDNSGSLLPDSTVLAQKYSWCRQMDGCAVGDAGDGAIVDLPSLLAAAYEVYINGGTSDAFSLLPMDFVQSMFFRGDIKGSEYVSMPLFKASMANAIQALTKPGTPYAGGTNLGNVTWHEAQYALLNNTYLVDSVIDKSQLWWSDGNKLTYPIVTGAASGDVLSLLEIAWRGYLEGYHPDYLKGLDQLSLGTDDDKLNNYWLWLRRNSDGQTFTGTTAFKTALEKAVQALQAGGKGYTTLDTVTWRELQYAVINGSYVSDAVLTGWQDSGIINYWWFDGGKKEMKTLEDLLNAVVQAKGDMSTIEVAVEFVTDVLKMRADFKGTEYTADTMEQFKAAMAELYGIYGTNLSTTLKASPNRVQYYIIHNAEASEIYIANNEANAYYWWFTGTGTPVTFPLPGETEKPADYLDALIPKLADAAYRYGVNGNKHAFDAFKDANVENISKYLRLYAAALPDPETLVDLTAVTDMTTFAKAMGGLSEALIKDSVEGNMYQQPFFTWNEAQYYLLNGGLPKENGEVLPDDTVYWWHYKDAKNDRQKTPLDFLLEYMKDYADTGESTKLENWLTFEQGTDAKQLSLKAKPSRGSTLGKYNENTWNSAGRPSILALARAAKAAGGAYWDGTQYTLTWHQVQYYISKFSALDEAVGLTDAATALSAVNASWAVPSYAMSADAFALINAAMRQPVGVAMTIPEQIEAITLQVEELTKRLRENPEEAENCREQINLLLDALLALQLLLDGPPPQEELTPPEVPPAEGDGGTTTDPENPVPEVPPAEGDGGATTGPENPTPEVPPTEGDGGTTTDPENPTPEVPPTEGDGGTTSGPENPTPEAPPTEDDGGATPTPDNPTPDMPPSPPTGSGEEGTATAAEDNGALVAAVAATQRSSVKIRRTLWSSLGGVIPYVFWDSGGAVVPRVWAIAQWNPPRYVSLRIAPYVPLTDWREGSAASRAAGNTPPVKSWVRNLEERIYA